MRDEEWREHEGLMLKEGKVYVPKDEKLRAEVIRLYHDTSVGRHGGQWKTTELVTRNFWWPGVSREVKQYVEGCDAYQHNKNWTQAPASKLMPNSIPEKPWSHISADFITKLPLAQGYSSILVVVDRLQKWHILFQLQRKRQQENWHDCSGIMSGNYMACQKVLFQIEGRSLQ